MIFNDEIFINREMTRLVKTNMETNEPIIAEAMIKTDQLFKNFSRNFGFETEILPSNCKYIKNFEDKSKIMILEDEPQVRTVSFDLDAVASLEFLKISGKYDLYNLKDFRISRPYKLTLSFPYIVYVMHLDHSNRLTTMNVFFRLHPITSLNDYLLKPCLPNINDDFKICLGGRTIEPKSYSLIDVTTSIINTFWFNNFNHDYFSNVNEYALEVPELSDFFTWAYHTKQDPMFIFSVNWIPCDRYVTLQKVIDHYNGSREHTLLNTLIKSIKSEIVPTPKNNENTYQLRSFCESINIDSNETDENLILAIGDEVKFNNKNYYVESILGDSYKNRGITLENDTEKIYVELSNDLNRTELLKNIKVTNPTSIQIGDNLIKKGDLVKFHDSGNIKFVEKIIKTADNMHQVKIGKYFYLENCFLKNNLEKIKEVEFQGETLKKDKEYFIVDSSNNYMIYGIITKGTFNDIQPDKNNEIILTFNLKNGSLFKMYHNETSYSLVLKENLCSPPVYRIGNNLFTNDYTKAEKTVTLHKNNGCLIQNQNLYLRDDVHRFIRYQKENIVSYLNQVCNQKTFTIHSYDHDLTYSIGDEVIFIDWKNPESMLQTKFITGFSMDDNYFYLSLKINNDSEEQKIPFIDLNKGRGDFASIRKACSEINDLKVGFRVKATSKICDFPMKDCNEIRAFVIDDIEPLVLFSNFRTLPVRTVLNSFKILKPGTKDYLKSKVSIPNLKIKVQDGDLFRILESGRTEERTICFVHGGQYHNSKVKFIQLIDGTNSCTYYMQDFKPYYHSRYIKNEYRYGLMLPRFTDVEFKSLPRKNGFPTLFSNITKEGYSDYTIRRDWKGEL